MTYTPKTEGNYMFISPKSPATTWNTKTPQDILSDVNALLDSMHSNAAAPDTIYVPRYYVYPVPIRFRVTGKCGKGAIERERKRQAKGLPIRRSLFERPVLQSKHEKKACVLPTETPHGKCPNCGALYVSAAGGGVVCTKKCGWWFCY